MSEQLNGGEVAAENTNLTSEPHVGEKLRLAREALGMSATDMAHALKLGQRQLEALEAGNWLGLPGNTFVRGFVRNYARLVNICLLYTSQSPRDRTRSRMPSSA